MNCGAEIVKFVLYLFNFFCMTCGAGLTAFGALMVWNVKDLNMKEMVTLNSMAILTLVLGIIIFCISFLGCCGAIGGKPGKLRAFCVLMMLLFVCQVTLSIYVWTKYPNIDKELKHVVQVLFDQRKVDHVILYEMQEKLSCCGVTGVNDYSNVTEPIPSSCCGHSEGKCEKLEAFKIGCSNALTNIWNIYSKQIKYSSVAAAGVMLMASVFASYLAHQIRRSGDSEHIF